MFVSVLLWQQVSLYILQRNRRGRLGFSQSVSVTHLFVPFTITTQELVPSPNRDSIVISIPATALMMTDCHLQAGPIFVFPRIHPLTLDAAKSRGKVYSRHEASQFVQFRIVEGREILSPRHGLRDTYIRAQDDLEDLRTFARNFAASFLVHRHRSEVICSLSTILLESP